MARPLKWLKIPVNLPDDPRVDELAMILGEDKPHHLLIDLWLWVSRFHQDGDLSEVREAVIERRAGWRGESGQFIAAMREVGFLDGSQVVAEWIDQKRNDAERKETGGVSGGIDAVSAETGGVSAETRGVSVPPLKEGEVEEEKEEEVDASLQRSNQPTAEPKFKRDDLAVLEACNAALGTSWRMVPSKAKKLASLRKAGATQEQLLAAPEGMKRKWSDPKYWSWDSLFRGYNRVEEFAEAATRARRPAAAGPARTGRWAPPDMNREGFNKHADTEIPDFGELPLRASK